MSNEVDKNEAYAAISAQRALLGVITPNLRAVTIKIDSQQKVLKVCFFYDKDISETQFDIASTAITEISADFPDFDLDDCIERLDFPSKVPVEGRLVFQRKED